MVRPPSTFDDMKAIFAMFTAGVFGLLCVNGCSSEEPTDSVSLTSRSPDGRYLVEIVELQGRLDRNFVLRLSDNRSGNSTEIFESPDEGCPPGTERIVWSVDGSKLLLMGENFYSLTAGREEKEEKLYLLYDLSSGEMKCNATQQNQYAGFDESDLKAIEWSTKIEQVESPNMDFTGAPPK